MTARYLFGFESLFLLLVVSSSSSAATYSFTNIADSNSAAPLGTFGTGFTDQPSINSGTVAFTSTYNGNTAEGVFKGNGGPLITIAKTGDPAPLGTFTTFGPPNGQQDPTSISNDIVAFHATFSDVSGNHEGIFNGSGGPLTTIVKTGDPGPVGNFAFFGAPSIDGIATAFYGYYGPPNNNSIFVGAGGSLTTLAEGGGMAPGGGTFNVFREISPLSFGTVALSATWGPGAHDGIVTESSGLPTLIAQVGDAAPVGNFAGFNLGGIHGTTVAFVGLYNFMSSSGYETGIFTGNGGPLTTIVKDGDPAPVGTFQVGDSAAINGSEVALIASYGNGFSGGVGIFTGSGGPLDAVIKTGDPLFGSTVSVLDFGSSGLDQFGNLTFRYFLANGRQGIAMATVVPEPSSIILLGAGATSLLGYVWRRRRRLKTSHNLAIFILRPGTRHPGPDMAGRTD